MNRNQDELVACMSELSPFDEHNGVLLENTHPPKWVNPKPARCYNLVVIGGGTAGLVAAAGAAGLGAKVALIERRLLGGDCLNTGCVPSKALIRCARAAAEARRAGEFGVHFADDRAVEVDFPAVMERMRRLRAGISYHDSAARFTGLGIDVFLGNASFVNGSAVRVGDSVLQFRRAVVATGARAATPRIAGLAEAGYLTNETVFSLVELPSRLAVIGGGPIGCEMAQTFARFGSTVTLIETNPRIMSREDHDASNIIADQLKREGVTLMTDASVSRVTCDGSSRVLHLNRDGKEIVRSVDAVLVAVGRQPNVEGLNLEAAGVAYDERVGVKVNDFLQTTNRRIYSAGDVCSALKFTHLSDFHARIFIRNALFFGRERVSRLVVPWCTYTDPEVAHVGMRAHDAKENGMDARTYTIGLDAVDRALLDGDQHGFVRILTRAGSDRILGATIVARHAGELISQMSLAMSNGIGLKKLAATIYPYPTQAEAIRKAADAFNRDRVTPRLKRAMAGFLSWRRR